MESPLVTGSIIERESRPPPRKLVTGSGFPERKKVEVPAVKPKVVPKVEEIVEEERIPPVPVGNKAPRFDFQGKIMSSAEATQRTIDIGLHHHGDNPEKPGYAIYELSILSRSRNISQRAGAYEMIRNIVFQDPLKHIAELQQVQIHYICVNAFNPPSSITIKSYALEIMQLLCTTYRNPLSLYPYPAIPPGSTLTFDFACVARDIAFCYEFDNRLLDIASIIIVASKPFDIGFLENAPVSLPLLHFARSVHINWGIQFGNKQALRALSESKDIEILKEAAVVLSFHQTKVSKEIISILPSCIKAMLLCKVDDCTEYKEYINDVLGVSPDPYAVDFLSKCATSGLLDEIDMKRCISGASFSAPYVVIAEQLEVQYSIPEYPKSEEECWERRGEICGMVQYFLLHYDFSMLPKLLPCLFSFTNPSADALIQSTFGILSLKERPPNPYKIFSFIESVPQSDLDSFLKAAKYFPLSYFSIIFRRKDIHDIISIIESFIDTYPDPMPANSLTIEDINAFIELFSFDSYDIPAFQKFAILCLSQQNEVEVRHTIWLKLQELAHVFDIDYSRQDLFEPIEDDMDILNSFLEMYRKFEYKNTAPFNISLKIVGNYLKEHKGEHIGKYVLENAMQTTNDWKDRILKLCC